MRTLRFKKFLENNSITGVDFDFDTKVLSTVSDDYYKMDLVDIITRKNGMILDVVLYEVNDHNMSGAGKFKFINSEIESLKGDILPLKMDGILLDIFDENEDAVCEFIYRLVDIINNEEGAY